jgi:hypothetical protein
MPDYSFVVSGASAESGAIYTNNSRSFIVTSTLENGALLATNGVGAPAAKTGDLVKSSGTGDGTISFSAVYGMSDHYFAQYITSEGTKIYMTLGPAPNTIIVKGERTVVRRRTLRGLTTAGAYRVCDLGVGTGGDIINLSFKTAPIVEYNALKAIYDTIYRVVYSPNNGTTKYLCAWNGGNSLDGTVYVGSSDVCAMTISLIKLSTL